MNLDRLASDRAVMRAALPLGADLFLGDVAEHLLPSRLAPTSQPIGDSNRRAGNVTRVAGETLRVPYRIYDQPLASAAELPPRTRRLWLAWCSRHHDGYVRAAAASELLLDPRPWVLPYLVQLLGEPVLEVADVVAEGLDARLLGILGWPVVSGFVADNQPYLALVDARVRSYRDAYYSARCRNWEAYPPRLALRRLRHYAATGM